MPGANSTATTQLLNWMHGLSGCLTRLKTEYGSLAEMIEHQDWDDNRTQYAAQLLESLAGEMAEAAEEVRNHVNGKFG